MANSKNSISKQTRQQTRKISKHAAQSDSKTDQFAEQQAAAKLANSKQQQILSDQVTRGPSSGRRHKAQEYSLHDHATDLTVCGHGPKTWKRHVSGSYRSDRRPACNHSSGCLACSAFDLTESARGKLLALFVLRKECVHGKLWHPHACARGFHENSCRCDIHAPVEWYAHASLPVAVAMAARARCRCLNPPASAPQSP